MCAWTFVGGMVAGVILSAVGLWLIIISPGDTPNDRRQWRA